MSEDKRQHLAASLSELSNQDKAWVINFLVQGLFATPSKKKAKRVHKDELTSEQWEEYFEHQPAIELPTETVPIEEVLNVTSGKTIKPMEKWL